MQHPDIFIMLLLVMAAALVSQYRSLSRKKFSRELENILRKEQNYEVYRQRLESPEGKRYFKQPAAALMLLDAAISLERKDTVRQLMEQLDTTRMNSTDFINYNMKKLAYGIQIGDAALAEAGWKVLHESRFANYVKKEADQLYDIYVLHQSNHIEELETFAAKAKNPSSKAMAYFRLAKQYHYRGDREICTEYLHKAKAVFPDKTWQGMMDEILKGDYSKLD